MAFEPMYDYFKADCLQTIGSQQIGVTAKLKALEDQEIDRVLCVSSSAMITGGEALSGEARYSGVAVFKAMYVSEKGSVECVSYDAEFTGRIEDASISPKLSPQFTCKVLDTQTDAVTRSEITISSALEITLAAVVENEVKYLSDAGEGIYTREEEISYSHVTSCARQQLTVTGDVEVKDVLKGVLLSSAEAIVSGASTGLDCYVIEGETYATVNYKGSDEAICKSVDVVLPFKEEIEAPGAMVGQRLAADCFVRGIKVTAEVDEETGKTRVFVEAELQLSGCSYADESLLAVCDVFSPEFMLGAETAAYETVSLSDTITGSEKVTGAFELTEGNEVDKVLGVAASDVAVSNCYLKEGKVVIEGVVTCTTVGVQNDSAKAIEIETPFSIAMNCPQEAEDGFAKASAAVSRVTARHKKTNEIDLTIELELAAQLYRKLSGRVIASLQVTGEKQRITCPMQVYVPRATDTLWDISKELSVEPDLIMSQNPGLKFPLGGGERILVYRQNKAKF